MQVLALVFAFIVGKQAPPSPPAENPHPPITAEDKTSVAFAEAMVKACLVDKTCPVADAVSTTSLGKLTESRHVHVVPRSTPRATERKSEMKRDDADDAAPMVPLKDDEYAVHLYARFEKPYGWHDVSVILSSGKDGKPVLRRILVVPMQSHHHLPPGAKC